MTKPFKTVPTFNQFYWTFVYYWYYCGNHNLNAVFRMLGEGETKVFWRYDLRISSNIDGELWALSCLWFGIISCPVGQCFAHTPMCFVTLFNVFGKPWSSFSYLALACHLYLSCFTLQNVTQNFSEILILYLKNRNTIFLTIYLKPFFIINLFQQKK